MIRELTETDRALLETYLLAEPEVNLFNIGNLENNGLGGRCQAWGEFGADGRLRLVLMRYLRFLNLNLREPDAPFDRDGVLWLLRGHDIISFAGERRSMASFGTIEGFKPPEHTHLCRLKEVACLEPAGINGSIARRLGPADIEMLADLYRSIAEFQNFNRDNAALRAALEEGSGRGYGIEQDGRMVAAAMTAAENRASAMIIGVATRLAYRGRGYATALMAGLCRDLLAEGKTACLFYDNPRAGRIYHRLGFEEIGGWTMFEKSKG